MRSCLIFTIFSFFEVGFFLATALAEQPTATTVRVVVTGLKNDTGQVGCQVFASSDGFPNKPEKAVRRVFVPIVHQAAVCEFKSLRPSTYAIAAMHDENSNRKFDTSILGVPTEGAGASRGARPGFMSLPKFDDAAIRFPAGVSTITVTIRY